MKIHFLNSSSRITILLLCFSLIIPFQNCSVYKSDGRKSFESSIAIADNKGCYPYIDTNLAMQFIGALDGSLNVYKNNVYGESAVTCDFRTVDHLLNHINCKVSQGSGDHATLLKQEGETAFEGILAGSLWNLVAPPTFAGLVHGGYVTSDEDSKYTIIFLALDGSELKGVACSVRLTPDQYNGAKPSIHDTLSKLSFEMAIQNKE